MHFIYINFAYHASISVQPGAELPGIPSERSRGSHGSEDDRSRSRHTEQRQWRLSTSMPARTCNSIHLLGTKINIIDDTFTHNT